MRDPVDIPYERVVLTERIGGVSLEIEALDDFERAVAALYGHLRGRGTARELADLSPMFGVIWPTARALASILAAEPLSGLTVLELGCGLGIPSLVAGALGGQVVATDQHPHAEAFLLRNLERNGITGVRYHRLDWREPSPLGRFDRVVASDVLFARELPELVAAMFARYLADDGLGLLTDPGRAWLQEMVDAAEALGLAVELDVVELPGMLGHDEGFLLRIRRRGTDAA